MAQITVQELQEIAVQCTSDFFNKEIPLNTSLAKQASFRGLNSDQLQRAVEATNTLTYLKSIDVAKDRTTEFPVADYKEIVKMASIPESILAPGLNTGSTVEPSPVEKQASVNVEDKMAFSFPTLTPMEQFVHLRKYAQINNRALERAKDDLEIAGLQLVKLAKEIKQNPQGLEHLSATSIEDDKFEKVAGLVFGKEVKRLDFVSGMFKSAQINSAQSFVDLYKQAETLYGEVEYRTKAQTQIEQGLEKVSFLGAAAKAIRAVSKTLTGNSRFIERATPLAVNKPARNLGRMAGSAVGGAVSGTVKTVGTTVGKTVSGLGTYVKNKAQNALAGTPVGKELKVPTKAMSPVVKRNLGIATVVGGGVLDASMYTPAVNPAKDMSGRVWDALQR